MQGDNIFKSTYEQSWPELNSTNKINSHNSKTRFESSSSLIQTNLLPQFNTAVQQCNVNLAADLDESLLRHPNYHEFAILNPSTSSSNIFNQQLVLGTKQSRLSYTGNFSSIGNQDTDVSPDNQCFIKNVGEIWKQEHFLSNLHDETTTMSNKPSPAVYKTSSNFQNELNKNPRIKHFTDQNKGLKTTNKNVHVKTSEFSLEQAASSFPELSTFKKLKTNQNSSIKEGNNSESVNIPLNKRTTKSWKPKVRDPILINLDQALQSLPEKNKPEPKKTTSATQQVPLPANILDSDKPQQRKGKVRPDKPKKPSKLKERILAIRKEKHKTSDGCEAQINVDELNEGISSLHVELNDKAVEENASKTKATSENYQLECIEFDDEPPLLTSENRDKEESCQMVNIHSRKFREYCTNCITDELVTNVCALLEKVAHFQDRLFVQNPLKASAKRRYVAGIHQTIKFLNVKKVKVLVIAPDLEKSPGNGGLDEKISNMIREAESQEIVCVFGPNRKRIGRTVRKNALVACIAILSYEGAEEQFAKVTESLNVARDKYQALTQPYKSSLLHVQDEKSEEISKPSIQEDLQHEDVTSTLLAKLRDNISPAGQLLRAINPRDWCGD